MPKQTKRNIDIATNLVALTVAIVILVLNASGYSYKANDPAKATESSTVTSGDATNTTSTGTDLSGSVSSTNAITSRGFEYGTDTNYGNSISDSSAKSPYNYLYQTSTLEGGMTGPISTAIGTNSLIYTVGSGFGNSVLTIKAQDGTLIKSIDKINNGSTEESFGGLRAVVVDSSNNIYLADYSAKKIYKLDSNANFISEFSTDNYPMGITLDSSNNIYISFLSNGISKYVDMGVTPPTNISVPSAPNAISMDSSNNLFVSSAATAGSGANVVYKLSSPNYTTITTIGSSGSGQDQLLDPQGIGINTDGNIYVADTGNSRTQIYNSDGSYNSSLPGYSSDASFDINNYLYISIGTYPTFSGIKKYAPVPTYTAGDFTLSLSDLACATTYHYRAFATNGDSSTNYGEDKTFNTGTCMTIATNPAGTSQPNSADLSGDISFSANTITARGFEWGTDTNYGNNLNDPSESFTTGNYVLSLGGLECGTTYHYRSYGTNSGGTFYGDDKTFTPLCSTMTISTEPASNTTSTSADLNGNISSSSTGIVARGFEWGTDTNYGNNLADNTPNLGAAYVSQFGAYGNGLTQFNSPQGMATDTYGNVYVVDSGNNRIQKFNNNGAYLGQIGEFGGADGQLWSPQSVAVDSSGYIYVTDFNNNRIQKFSSFGVYQAKFSAAGAYGIALDSSDNLVTTDLYESKVEIFNKDFSGDILNSFGSGGTDPGQFNAPRGVTVDGSNNIYVADTFNNRIQKLSYDGTPLANTGSIEVGTGDGQFNKPYFVAIGNSGNIYTSDTYNDRVQIFNTDLSFVSKFGSTGDGNGQFNNPIGLTIDSSGNIYVADNINSRIQRFANLTAYSTGEYTINLSGLTCQTYHYRAYGTNMQDTYYGEDIAFNPCMTIITQPADPVGNFGATLNGNIINSGSVTNARGFEWGTTPSYGNTTSDNNPNYYYKNNLTISNAGSESSPLSSPSWAATSPSGDVYVVDQGNNRILQYDSSGAFIVSHGQYGNELGQFNSPNSIAFDSNGNIYVTDGGNMRVQKFNSSFAEPSLIDSSICPDGEFTNPIGIAIDSSNNIYVTDVNTQRILIFEAGPTCRKITNAAMAVPIGIAVSPAGFIGVTDPGSNQIHAFDSEGNLIASIPMDGTPVGIALDSTGYIYVSLLFGNTVAKINPVNGSTEYIITISNPIGISIDSSDNVLVASAGVNQVQRYGQSPYFGTGNYSGDLTNLSCGTSYHYRAYATNETGTYYGEDQSFTTNSCMDITTNDAQNITDNSAQLYGTINSSVSAITARGFQLGTDTSYGQTINDSNPLNAPVYNTQFGQSGDENGQFNDPTGIAVATNGNIYISDANNNRVQIFNSNNEFIGLLGGSGSEEGQFSAPGGIAIDSSGYIYVADSGNNRVQKFNPDNSFNSVIGSPGSENGQFAAPAGITIDSSNNLFVADSDNQRVQKFNPDGSFNSKFGTPGAGNGEFYYPVDVAVANDGSIYVSDPAIGRVQKFNSSFVYQNDLFLPSAPSTAPVGVSIDNLQRIYVADYLEGVLYLYNSGNSNPYFTLGSQGNDNSQFYNPKFITTDSLNNLYVSDSGNNRIQLFNYQNIFNIGEYNLGTSILQPCTTYHFRAFGTNQNGTFYGNDNTFQTTGCNPTPPTPPTPPAPTPIPPVSPTTPVAPQTFSGGSAPQIISESGTTADQSSQTNQATQPAKTRNIFEAILFNLESLAKKVPGRVAVAIPYGLILLLLILALLYYILSYSEYRNSKKYRSLLIRQDNLLLGGQNFIALTSHYLNSPISTMQVAVGMLIGDNLIGKLKGESIMKSLNNINKATNSLLKHNSQSTEKIMQGIDAEPKEIISGRYLFSPLVWIPTVIATVLLVSANILFLRANIFTVNAYSISSQILLLLVGIILILMSWRSYRRNHLLEKKRELALKKERALNNAKTKFIAEASTVMQKDLKIIQQSSAGLKNSKQAQELKKGLAGLLAVEESLMLLEEFNNYQPTTRLGTKELKKSIDNSIKTHTDQIKLKNLDVTTHLKGGISIKIDHKALNILISSALSNAVKFSHNKGKIDIYAQMSAGDTIIEVRDNGIGIPRDKLDGIMTPFSRATSAIKFDQEGIGLSLYMNRIIIDQIGGNIMIKSNVRQGTKLIMSIPGQ